MDGGEKVAGEAVRLWQRQQDQQTEWIAAARARIQRSLGDSRPDVPMAEVFDRMAIHHANASKPR
jgi:Arc/MetJ-type ribon-helix-helix transcriptional regulator